MDYQIFGALNLGGPYLQLANVNYPNDTYTIDSSIFFKPNESNKFN